MPAKDTAKLSAKFQIWLCGPRGIGKPDKNSPLSRKAKACCLFPCPSQRTLPAWREAQSRKTIVTERIGSDATCRHLDLG
jgi:hypothetical protein